MRINDSFDAELVSHLQLDIEAGEGAIRRLVVHQTMLPVVLGAVLGVVASLRLAPVVESPLLAESQFDPATIAVAVGVLLACALAGSIIPVRRALRVDPVTALRAE